MLGQVLPVSAAKSIRCVSEIFRRVPFDDSLDFVAWLLFDVAINVTYVVWTNGEFICVMMGCVQFRREPFNVWT